MAHTPPSAARTRPHTLSSEVLRYVVNGLFATAVHYGVLSIELRALGFTSAGLSNMVAAIFGITASFLGSRYFVFRQTDEGLWHQARKFALLYTLIALLNGAIMATMTDHYGVDYRVTFLIATILQMALSYAGNKWLVFRS